MAGENIPAPPSGYVMQGATGVPPPPPGYQVQGTSAQAPSSSSQLPKAVSSPTADDYRSAGMSVPANLRSGNESWFQQLNDQGNDLGDAFVHNAAKIVVGPAQLLQHGITAATDAVLPAGNSVRQYVDSSNAGNDASISQNEAQYQHDVPNNIASYTGATIGNVAPFLFEAPAKALSYVGDAAKVLPKASGFLGKASYLGNQALSSAAQGAAISAAQPITDTSQGYGSALASQIRNGALIGGALPIAGKAITGTYGGVKNALANVFAPETVAANALGRTLNATPETLNALTNIPAGTPGVSPTTAQVLGTPRAVMVEKAAANNPAFKEQLVQNQNTNNDARLTVLRNMAGDDASLQAARDARTAATQPFIDANLQPATPAIRWNNAAQPIDAALSHNMIQNKEYRALDSAQKLIKNVRNGSIQEDDALSQMGELLDLTKQNSKAYNAIDSSMKAVNQNMIDPSSILKSIATTRNASSLGQNPTVQKALTQIDGQIKGAQNINGLVPANVLDGIRQNVARILQANHDPNALIGSQEEAGIAPVKQQLTNTLNKSVPGFMDYLANYAKYSQPINDMQAAGAILENSGNGGIDSSRQQILSLAHVNRGLKVSGNARYGLSPGALEQVQGLKKSLQQDTVSNSIRSPGSDTNFNAQAQGWLGQKILGSNLQGTGGMTRTVAASIGALAGEHFGGVGGAAAGMAAGGYINKAAGILNDRIMAPYHQGLLDPATARTMIAKYLNQNQAQAPALLQQFPAWRALVSGVSARPAIAAPTGTP